MAHKKKTKRAPGPDAYDEAVDSLAQIVAEELQGHPHTALEPFELYADRVRSRVKGDMDKFRQRFAQGYHVLLEELSKEHEKS